MIIVKSNIWMNSEMFLNLYADLVDMTKKGVVLLPSYCELLNEVPPDTEVVVVKEKERARGGKQ